MSPTLGVVFLPQWAPERLRSVAAAAEEAGLEELWLWEDCFRESGIAASVAALATTERLTVGLGLIPVPLRNVALTAMEIATIARMFPGRLRPGVGHGVLEWMAQVGARVDSPITLLREYTTALRGLLDGERVSTIGRYVRLDDVQLDWPPQNRPRLLVGGIGPKTLTLSAQVADGTILTGGTTPAAVRQARNTIDEARAAAGVSNSHELIVYLLAATGPNGGPRLLRELEHWRFDPRQDVGIHGDAAQIAESAHRWIDAGADTVVLQPTADEPDIDGFIGFVAREVRPLL